MVHFLIMLWFIMGLADVDFDRKLAVTGCLAFAPVSSPMAELWVLLGLL